MKSGEIQPGTPTWEASGSGEGNRRCVSQHPLLLLASHLFLENDLGSLNTDSLAGHTLGAVQSRSDMVPEGRFKVSIHKTLMQPCLGEQTFDTNTEHEERRPCLLQTLATSPRVQPLLPFSTSQQDPGLPLVPVFLVAPHISAPPWPRGKSPGILSQLCLPRVTGGVVGRLWVWPAPSQKVSLSAGTWKGDSLLTTHQ